MVMAEAASGGGSERVRQIADLWRTVLGRPQHSAGCNCMAHFLMPAMNGADLESDILEYLRGRYVSEGLTSLVCVLDERLAQHETKFSSPFRAWLLRLPEQEIDSGALRRLLADLQTTLASFESNSRQGGQGSFVCY